MRPKISVVLPVWNGELFLRAAIDSIFAQTFTDFELIVVDDGSTDRTNGILQSYSDPRLAVHRLDHSGIVAALNYGVAMARAEWIARQDADDISQPMRFSMQWEALRLRKAAVLSFTDTIFIGELRNRAGRARFPQTKAFMALRLCYQSPIVHSTVIFQKDAFLHAGGYRAEERHAEDYSLWGRMLELGDFVGVPQALLEFRLHSASVSKTNSKEQLALTSKISARHCQRFMQLNEKDAERAARVLARQPEQRSPRDWFWFLTRCAPRFKWKSAELYGWIIWQTLRNFGSLLRRWRVPTSAISR